MKRINISSFIGCLLAGFASVEAQAQFASSPYVPTAQPLPTYTGSATYTTQPPPLWTTWRLPDFTIVDAVAIATVFGKRPETAADIPVGGMHAHLDVIFKLKNIDGSKGLSAGETVRVDSIAPERFSGCYERFRAQYPIAPRAGESVELHFQHGGYWGGIDDQFCQILIDYYPDWHAYAGGTIDESNESNNAAVVPVVWVFTE